jgi:transcriptional antiterminator RfaH
MLLASVTDEQWFLIYTRPNQEKIAKINLENQGFETYLPIIDYSTSNKNKASSEVLFPRYLFIKFDQQKSYWGSIKSTKGVSHIIMFGDTLAIIKNEIIIWIQNKLNKNQYLESDIDENAFKENDSVIINDGMLKGSEATFLSMSSKNRIRVLLNFINKDLIAEVSAEHIEGVSIKKHFKL